MINNIYMLAKDFPSLRSIMENAISSDYVSLTGNCSSFGKDIFPTSVSYVENICKQVEAYTGTIEQHHWNMLFNSKSSCIYLYYWLYYYNNKEFVSHVENLYKKLIETLDSTYSAICSECVYTTITDDEMSNLRDLHDMYSLLNNTNGEKSTCGDNCGCAQVCSQIYKKHMETCIYNNDTYFCKELLNIKKKYDEKMKGEKCGTGIPKTLPSFQRYNITTITLIPIFVILAISSFLYILYKVNIYDICFMPYSSRFRCVPMKKRKKYNNIVKEKDMLELSETSSCYLTNNRYNILYNSK
ncbi:variable surface protein [Plasmodium gonderi]|uniref:Variable surface protein n=1 Tax=Plasmodium gonderi TaxID=77519 RepID=A0A1Y1JQP4_PLAGO|nr:variable surface protein [Plasmodium gonderi]GAW84540.1 variable surface protein [Plasmodium gonderi]